MRCDARGQFVADGTVQRGAHGPWRDRSCRAVRRDAGLSWLPAQWIEEDAGTRRRIGLLTAGVFVVVLLADVAGAGNGVVLLVRGLVTVLGLCVVLYAILVA